MIQPWMPMLAMACALQGCAVVTVASTAVSVTAGVVGVAADAAIGTAKIVGKGVGKAADAVLDDDKSAKSGTQSPDGAEKSTEPP